MAKSAIVDTNVIIRYLLKDNQEYYLKSESLFNKALNGEIAILIIQSVIVKTIYVLMKLYRLTKKI